MKTKLITALTLLLLASSSYSFCVYNHTKNNDTTRRFPGSYQSPTIMSYAYSDGGKVMDQGDYGCSLTKRRGQTDVSTVNIYWLKNYYYVDWKMVCSVNVYNKGGYVVITGDLQSGFNCEVHRDPQK